MKILKLSSDLISGCLLFQVHLGGVTIRKNQGHMTVNWDCNSFKTQLSENFGVK